jgi:hypothetical protein
MNEPSPISEVVPWMILTAMIVQVLLTVGILDRLRRIHHALRRGHHHLLQQEFRDAA